MPGYGWQGYPQSPDTALIGRGLSRNYDNESWALPNGDVAHAINASLPGGPDGLIVQSGKLALSSNATTLTTTFTTSGGRQPLTAGNTLVVMSTSDDAITLIKAVGGGAANLTQRANDIDFVNIYLHDLVATGGETGFTITNARVTGFGGYWWELAGTSGLDVFATAKGGPSGVPSLPVGSVTPTGGLLSQMLYAIGTDHGAGRTYGSVTIGTFDGYTASTQGTGNKIGIAGGHTMAAGTVAPFFNVDIGATDSSTAGVIAVYKVTPPPPFVQHVETALKATSVPLSVARPVTGNRLVAWANSDATVTIADNGSGAWTLEETQVQGNGIYVWVKAATATDNTSLTTITFTPSVNDIVHCGFIEISGMDPASLIDAHVSVKDGTTGTSSPVTSGITTTGANGDLVLAWAFMHTTASLTVPVNPTWTNGYTNVPLSPSFGDALNGTKVTSFLSYLSQGTAGATNTQASWTPAWTDRDTVLISFKVAPPTFVGLAATAGMTVGATVTTPTPKFSTLVETFSAALNPAVWFNSSSTQCTIVSGQLQIASTANVSGDQFIQSINSYDLTESSVALQLVDSGTAAGVSSWEVLPIVLQSPGSNWLFFYINNTYTVAFKLVGGTQTQLWAAGYDANAHKWLRIREHAGSVYWEYSANGSTWTTAWSEPDPFSTTAMTLTLQAGTSSGQTSTTAAVFDNVNSTPTIPQPPVTGYSLWCDASQITGVADGTTLSTWPDASGNGNSLTQTTVADEPTYYSSTSGKLINGLPAVWFNGTTDTMATAALASVSARTIFVVGKTSTLGDGNATGAVFVDGQSGSQRNLISDYTGSAGTTQWTIYAGTLFNPGVAADANLHVFGAIFNGTSSYLNIDGTLYGPGDTGSQPYTGIAVGATPTGAGYDVAGPICEVIVYPSALSTTNVASVVSYLNTKWVATGPATVTGAVTETATAGMTIGSSVQQVATVNMAATAGLTTSPVVIEQAGLTMAATAGMTVTATRIAVSTVAPLVATAGMTVTATVIGSGAAVTLAATAVLTAVAAVTELAAVTMSAAASLTAIPTITQFGVVPLSATTSLTVVGTRTQFGVVPLAASASLTVAASMTEVAVVSFVGTTSLTTTAIRGQFAIVLLAGASGLTVAAVVTEVASVALAGSSALTVTSLVTERATVALAATAGLSIAQQGMVQGIISMTASASMTVVATVLKFADVSLAGTAGMTVTSRVTEVATVSLAAATSMTVVARVTIVGRVDMTADTSLVISEQLVVFSPMQLSAVAALNVAGTVITWKIVQGAVFLIGETGMVVVANITAPLPPAPVLVVPTNLEKAINPIDPFGGWTANMETLYDIAVPQPPPLNRSP